MSKSKSEPQDIKTLSQLREELDPQGAAIQKDDILGELLQVQKVKPWKSKAGKDCVRVIAVVQSTGELVHFNGGQPMYNGLRDYIDHVPFFASISKQGEGDDAFYLLE